MRQGQGTVTYPDGTKAEGQWEQGVMTSMLEGAGEEAPAEEAPAEAAPAAN